MQFHHTTAFLTNHFTAKTKYRILDDLYVIVKPWLVRLYVEIIREWIILRTGGQPTILYHLHQCRPCTS